MGAGSASGGGPEYRVRLSQPGVSRYITKGAATAPARRTRQPAPGMRRARARAPRTAGGCGARDRSGAVARQRLLKKEPRGHPERLSDGHGPEAVATVRSPRESLRRPRPGSGDTRATPPRHDRLNAATRPRNTGTTGPLGSNHLRKKPAHRTRGETDVIQRGPELCSAPGEEFLKIHKKRHQRHQRQNREAENSL